MARLIDADSLKEEVEFQQEHMWPEDLSRRIPGMIDNAPTIAAIPVEWLEEHDSKGNEYGMRYITVVEALSMWQKEQEAQDG